VDLFIERASMPKESVLPVSASSSYGESKMDECTCSLLTTQLAQSGVIAQNNFITVQKVVDYDYLENKRMVTLDEAIGVREVSSKSVPAGPISPGAGT